MLVSNNEVDQRAVPAAKEGALASSEPALPIRMTLSPMEKMRKPAARRSSPALKNLMVSSAVATMRPKSLLKKPLFVSSGFFLIVS